MDNYLEVYISNNRDTLKDRKHQAHTASRIPDCIWETIWRNKHISVESKIRINKAIVGTVLTYDTETRAETKNNSTSPSRGNERLKNWENETG